MKRKTHSRQLSEEPWHALDPEDCLEELRSSLSGLDEPEAAHRLEYYGLNILPAREPPTLWGILLHQILHPLIFILLAAAVASMVIGESADAAFILLVILLNTALGAYQEYQAEQSAAKLQSLLQVRATVRRGGSDKEAPAEQIVPGDIVLLESGNKVPADLRLLEANQLALDESFLTGESVPVEKRTHPVPEDALVSERSNMAFAGSTVTTGRGLGVTVATGSQTQMGQIATSVAAAESAKPPLLLRMEKFVRQVTFLILFISAWLALLLRLQGHDTATVFFFVVALAVSAIPEGLPVALTVALSVATRRMSNRNVVVRKLTSVESLGSCTVIASDKTGTLTVNQQTARQPWLPEAGEIRMTGEGYNGEGEAVDPNGGELPEPMRRRLKTLAELSILANEASLVRDGEEWRHRGDAMDVAFLAMGYKLGLDPEQIRREIRLTHRIPYESERKFAAAFYEKEATMFAAAKGAVETILQFCSSMETADKTGPLDPEAVQRQAEVMAKQGLRVLAVAGGPVTGTVAGNMDEASALQDLVFHGLVGFLDPLRPEAADAVDKCKKAGVQVLMITGDHPFTAGAIARELGLSHPDEPVVTGRDLSEAGTPDSPAYEKRVSSSHVFARVSPAQKLEIVDVLIRKGEFVAVTGDGVNDAPALRRAHIGVAMGSGTDVAKEVGSMIITDDNFASIVAGIEEGRFAYDNVRKVIYLLVSTGAAEVLMFLASVLSGMPIPLLAVQLLWLNLVTNGIQDIALAFEGGEPGAMKRPPRSPDEKIFNPQMVSQTLVSGLTMGALAFAFWLWLIEGQGVEEASARNLVLLLMVLLQNVHAFNCRSETTSVFRIPISRNPLLVIGVLLAQGIHLLSMHVPLMQNLLRAEPVPFSQWLTILAMAASLLVVMELFKAARRQRSSP